MIEMQNLRREFGGTVAVNNISLTVPGGQLFCFLGPNGAGKTTTIKMLTGLLRPTSGTVRICGIDIQADPIKAKKIVGYIPDMPFLYDRLTIAEFVEFTGDIYAMPSDQVRQIGDELLSTFGMFERKSSLIKDLSYGMRQRVTYVATLLHSPEVLFIDEPLIGLDPHTIRLIKNLLVAKARSGMTIFLTTHILALAEDIADRIGIVSKGSIIALGTLQELRKEFRQGGSLEDLFIQITGETEKG